MNRRMKEQLKNLYEAPKPVGKRAFFRKLNPQPLCMGYVLWTQISYVSKWEWILSVVFFDVTVFISKYFETRVLSAVLAMMPFLAVASVSESMRSVTYGMEELEMTARFSLKSIILGRMGIVGIENLVLAFLAAYFIKEKLMQTVLYLLVPYLITVYGSFHLVRKVPGREGIYASFGFSVVVSMAVSVSILNYNWIYKESYYGLWFITVAFLLYITFKESRRTVQLMGCYN